MRTARAEGECYALWTRSPGGFVDACPHTCFLGSERKKIVVIIPLRVLGAAQGGEGRFVLYRQRSAYP